MLSSLLDFRAPGQAIQRARQFSAPETTYHGFMLVLRLNKNDLFFCVRLVSLYSSLPLMLSSTSSN